MRVRYVVGGFLFGHTFASESAASDNSLKEGLGLAQRGRTWEAAVVFGDHCKQDGRELSNDESRAIAWACSNFGLALTNLGKWPQAYAALRSAYENGASESLVAQNRKLLLFWVQRNVFRDAEGFSPDGAERALARVANDFQLQEAKEADTKNIESSWRSFLDDPLAIAWNHFPQVAQLLRRLGLRREAREAFRAAAFFQPERDAFLSNLGAALIESGDLPEAFAALEAARVLKGPSLSEVEANLAVIHRAAGGGFAALRARAPQIKDLLQRRLSREMLEYGESTCDDSDDSCAAIPLVRAQRSGTFVCMEECKWSDQAVGSPGTIPSSVASDVILSARVFQEAAHWLFAPEEWYLWDGLVLGYTQQPAKVASMAAAADCLPDIPIIYVYPPLLVAFSAWVETMLRRKYILITAGSDFVASANRFILQDPFLVHWFAAQVDVNHSKISPIPRGVPSACLPELSHGLSELQSGSSERSGLFLAGFERQAHPVHQRWWNILCGKDVGLGKTPFATCMDVRRTRGGTLSVYQAMASHRFVAVPAGFGLDPAEIWESLHLGAVPVIESSTVANAHLYEGLPVLIIEDIADLTTEKLDREYDTLVARFESDVPDALRGVPGVAWMPAFRMARLRPMSWQGDIARKREAELLRPAAQSSLAGISNTRKAGSAAPSRRCWGH